MKQQTVLDGPLARYGISLDEGYYVTQVAADSVASRAGVKVGLYLSRVGDHMIFNVTPVDVITEALKKASHFTLESDDRSVQAVVIDSKSPTTVNDQPPKPLVFDEDNEDSIKSLRSGLKAARKGLAELRSEKTHLEAVLKATQGDYDLQIKDLVSKSNKASKALVDEKALSARLDLQVKSMEQIIASQRATIDSLTNSLQAASSAQVAMNRSLELHMQGSSETTPVHEIESGF